MKTNKNNTVMKKIATVLALVSLLGVLAVSCQKETTGNPLPAVVIRTVDYCIGDNAPQQTVLHGDVQWQSFLAAIFDSVDRGYRVSLIHGGAAAKEAVTFSTTVKADAIAWVDSMYNAGYDVTLWYDDTTGQYNAVAQKSTAPGPITPDTLPEHTFYPFDEYLPGTWICVDYMAFIRDAYNPNQTWVNDYFFNEDYNPNHHPPLPYFSYIMPRMFLWPTSPDMHSGPLKMTITEDSITIEAPNVPLTTMDSNTMDYWTEEGDSLRIYTTHPDMSSYYTQQRIFQYSLDTLVLGVGFYPFTHWMYDFLVFVRQTEE